MAVGDDEWKNPDPADYLHDLDMETHLFYNRVRRVPKIMSELRVYGGGHDWQVWRRGFEAGCALSPFSRAESCIRRAIA